MRPLLWLIPILAATFVWLRVPLDCGSACNECSAMLLPDLATMPLPAPVKPAVERPSLPYPAPPPEEQWRQMPAADRLADVHARVRPLLAQELQRQDLKLGNPAFVRIYKETRELELWLKGRQGWKLFRTYPVAAMSGVLGPKMQEGDRQAPEGFYGFSASALNAGSTFHLSFNIGYPNAHDRHHGRTGTHIMVHGNQVSIGCFAMTDPVIEEIYLVVEAALEKNGGEVPVHVFPFRMNAERLAQETGHPSHAFWQDLLPLHDAFEKESKVPRVDLKGGRYVMAR